MRLPIPRIYVVSRLDQDQMTHDFSSYFKSNFIAEIMTRPIVQTKCVSGTNSFKFISQIVVVIVIY